MVAETWQVAKWGTKWVKILQRVLVCEGKKKKFKLLVPSQKPGSFLFREQSCGCAAHQRRCALGVSNIHISTPTLEEV